MVLDPASLCAVAAIDAHMGLLTSRRSRIALLYGVEAADLASSLHGLT